ncbi:MAG TPA: polyphosphate kinase 2 family protein [Candidatus Saccharimonadia bacterium]|nr:polyphosphate kinase 2 family protein [Candidatus Saccharimonadia bacterium]
MADTHAQPSLRERLLVRPGRKVDLAAFDPDATFGHQKAGALEELTRGVDRLTDLQERLWANGGRAVLIVLQGIDTAGKDGTIRHVMGAFNPQGCDVVGFKVPTPEELAHDFLWRAHKAVPPKGSVAIFNRSHYEDVLVVRVHELVPESVWRQRYGQINEFEQLLSETGTTILKFFLLIDQDEQKARLQARLDDPTKRWKFSSADFEERKRWDAYTAAYEEMLERCSLKNAPWYVIPSNRKWFRNLAVADILADTLDDLHLPYPEAEEGLDAVVVE